MYLRALRVFLLEHYFVREAFNSAYCDEELSNKATVHRLVSKFRDTGSVCLWRVFLERQNSSNYWRTDLNECIICKKSVLLLVSLFFFEKRFVC